LCPEHPNANTRVVTASNPPRVRNTPTAHSTPASPPIAFYPPPPPTANIELTNLVRNLSLNNEQAVRGVGQTLDQLIEQSGGQNEYEARVEIDPNTNLIRNYSIV
ncbi:5941_t:CDS:1, partial [Paraglomus occultum]